MSYSDRQGPTEQCPLTKESSRNCRLNCCRDSFNFIVFSFVTLTFAITVTLILQLLYTDNGPQDKNSIHGAVATDYANCSQIGTKLMRKGGNAIDAAVAAAICIMVVAPHKSSLGGGGYLMVYDHKERSEPVLIDFAQNTIKGAFAAEGKRVPAVLRGLEFAHNKYGNLAWYQVVEPSVQLAKDGFVVSKEFAYEASQNVNYKTIYGSLNAGEIIKLTELANTLDEIARYGTDALYNGTLAHKILWDGANKQDILEELANYYPEFSTVRQSIFYGYAVYYPSHASQLQSLLEALQELEISKENSSTIESQISVARTLIFSNVTSSKTMQNTIQERYSDITSMDWQDKYVCIVIGLSKPLGLQYMTKAGFLLDTIQDENDLSTFNPIIFHDKEAICGLRGVFGTDDTILSVQLLYNFVVRALNISLSIENARYYLLSDGIAIETDQRHFIEKKLYTQLTSIVPLSNTDANVVSKSVNSIIKWKDSMISHSDSRGGGLASRF